MTKKQRLVLVMALLAIVAMLIWVPYTATYKWRDSSWTTVSAGYDWLFTEPSIRTCRFSIEDHIGKKFTYNFNAKSCHVSLDARRLVMTIGALGIGSTALLIMLGLFGTRTLTSSRHSKNRNSREVHAAQQPQTEVSELARELLRANPLFQISTGDMTKNSPLVLTCKDNYVESEYQILEIINSLFKNQEADFHLQGLIQQGDRMIDAITYKYRDKGTSEWTEKKTFYFDITTGYAEASRKRNKSWWQIWK